MNGNYIFLKTATPFRHFDVVFVIVVKAFNAVKIKFSVAKKKYLLHCSFLCYTASKLWISPYRYAFLLGNICIYFNFYNFISDILCQIWKVYLFNHTVVCKS